MLSLVLLTLPPPPQKKALGINFKLRKCLSMPMPILDNLEYDPTKKKVGGGGYTVSAKLAIIYLDNV